MKVLSARLQVGILLFLAALRVRADPDCVPDCSGMPNGDYPSCDSCNSFVTCSNEILYTMPCPANLQFDNTPDSNNIKHCLYTSTTCRPSVEGCPPGYSIKFQNSCYYVSSNTDTHWNQARQGCAAVGAHLAEVDDADEQNYLISVLDVQYPTPPPTASDALWWGVWIGATDVQTEGTFIWESSNRPLTYTNWNGGEPNNEGNEDCATMVRRLNWRWNDRQCHLTDLAYLCEKELS